MTGSILSIRSGQRSCCLGNVLRGGMHHDIYASYSDKNNAEVRPILDVLRQKQLTVYDPYIDGMPNETVFQAWLERGIYKAKLSLILLTKSFVQNPVCRFQSDSAVMHYVKTKGRHRIVLVMLESCRVPKNLRQFNCVFAWQHLQDPGKQHLRILTAIFAPKTKFRRGSLLWSSGNTSAIAKKKCCDIPSFEPKQNDLKHLMLLLNLSKIKFALENCQLVCSSDNCSFRCDGVLILDQFLPHIKECKYQKVRCSFCRQRVQRKNLQRHEERACRLKPAVCPNEGCGKKLPAKLLYGHIVVCPYREGTCRNQRHGCNDVFAIKDRAKHLEICDYEQQGCKRCHNIFFRLDFDSHECRKSVSFEHSHESYTKPVPAVYNCRSTHCEFSGTRQEVDAHLHKCVYKIEQCSDCGTRLPMNELIWHKKQCDKLVECEVCHQSVASSSKILHDRWSCRGQNMQSMCEKCQSWISYGALESHISTCTSQATEENVSDIRGVMPVETHARNIHDVNIIPMPQQGMKLENNRKSMDTLSHSLRAQGGRSDMFLVTLPSPPSPPIWNQDRRQRWRALMNTIDHNVHALRPIHSHGREHYTVPHHSCNNSGNN